MSDRRYATEGSKAKGDKGTLRWSITRLQTVHSTNEEALARIEAGALEGTVIVADHQAAGRGRRGGAWYSPPGKNLYFSMLLRPKRPQQEWPDLPWTVAAAVAAVLSRSIGKGLAIKPPNDVRVGGKKISGTLVENRVGPDRPGLVAAGVGVNVNLAEEDLPDDLAGRATSLYMVLGRNTARETLLEDLLEEVGRFMDLWNSGGVETVRRRIASLGIELEEVPGGHAASG